jgi:glycosyltransferase involved in cell wall biosynthesis
MSNGTSIKNIRTRAIYLTPSSTPNRGGMRYILNIINQCNFDERKIIYIDSTSAFSWIKNVLKYLRENVSQNELNIVFIRGAPVLDSIGPILFKLFFNRNIKLIAPLFHLNPLSPSKNRYDKSTIIFSFMQRIGAFLEIFFADIFLTENTYISKYIRKFRKNAKVVVKQLGIAKNYIPNIEQILTADKDIDFLYVGGLDKSKGVEDILRAFKPISKDHSLIIAGYGSKDWLERLINRKYNLENVSIYTNISEEEKFKLYLRSKVYVFPSVADGIPITFHEAWAYGNLIVTYMLPTYIDIKDRIFCVPQLNIEKLREKMVYVLSNYDKYKELIVSNYWYAVKNSNSPENVQEICDKIYRYLNIS